MDQWIKDICNSGRKAGAHGLKGDKIVRVEGTSLAYEFDEHKLLEKCQLTLPQICDHLLAREDVGNLQRIYQKEAFQNGLISERDLDDTALPVDMRLRDYPFPNKCWYRFDKIPMFSAPHHARLWKQESGGAQELVTLKSGGDTSRFTTPRESSSGRPLLSASTPSVGSAQRGDQPQRDEILRKCERVGLVGPSLSEEQVEEIRTELSTLKSSGYVFVFCKYEADVDICLDMLKSHQKQTKEGYEKVGGTPSVVKGGQSPSKEVGRTKSVDEQVRLLEAGFPEYRIFRTTAEPTEILWENYRTDRT